MSDFDLAIDLLRVPNNCNGFSSELTSHSNIVNDIEASDVVGVAIHKVLLVGFWVEDNAQTSRMVHHFPFRIEFKVVSAVKRSISVDIVD